MATKMTLASIQAQIDKLTKQAEMIRSRETSEVIAKIKVAINAYGLTAADLGLSAIKSPRAAKKTASEAAAKKKGKSPIRFRDSNGNSWTGFGRKPGWLKEALAAGVSLEALKA